MNEKMTKAMELLRTSTTDFCSILKDFSKEFAPEDFADLNSVYETASSLKILTSQFTDKNQPCVREGLVSVDNKLSMVTIDGVEITGNIQFEILENNNWIKGHRENSQMGQIFVSPEKSLILSSDIKGRVFLPLTADIPVSTIPLGTCAPVSVCAPAASCSPVNTCSPVSTCSPNGTCSPVSTCSPSGTCSPVSNCSPNGTCSPVSTCSPSGTCSPSDGWMVFK